VTFAVTMKNEAEESNARILAGRGNGDLPDENVVGGPLDSAKGAPPRPLGAAATEGVNETGWWPPWQCVARGRSQLRVSDERSVSLRRHGPRSCVSEGVFGSARLPRRG
jgi:hypothetical protein